jgi:exopolysaccharide production protein ExoZ
MKRLDNLQVLRGVAAALVVLDHTLLSAALHDPTYVQYQGFAATIGRMGVNIFFIISGFIMVHSTESTKDLGATSRVQDFVFKRATRLIPLYWLATFVQIAVSAVGGIGFTIPHILSSLAFLPNFFDTNDPRLPPVLGVGWTLNYEIFFYAIFAATLLLPRRLGLWTCVFTIVALVATGVLGMKYVGSGTLHRIFFFYTYKNMLFFAVGIALAMAQRFLPKLAGAWPLGLALMIMTGALAFFRIMGFGDGDPIWQSISLVVCTTAVMLALSEGSAKVTGGSRLILHIGNASFSTYLFHAMILGALAPAEGRLLGSEMGFMLLLTGPLLCLAAGSIIHIFVERPLTQIVRLGQTRHRSSRAAEQNLQSVVLDR